MGLAFFPRGGSAHVARNLAAALGGAGWDVTVLSGSLTRPGEPGDAREFYAGLDVRPLDMTAALGSQDPMRADPGPRTASSPRSTTRLTSARSSPGAGRSSRSARPVPTCCTCTT